MSSREVLLWRAVESQEKEEHLSSASNCKVETSMNERYSNINEARAELIDALESFGKIGVLWLRPVLTDYDHKELLKETRASGWRVKCTVSKREGQGDRYFPAWDVCPAGNWSNNLKALAQLPSPGELKHRVIPNPNQADAACKERNAAWLAAKRTELRRELLTLGGITLKLEEEQFFPPVLLADLQKELKQAGWTAKRGYCFGDNRVCTRVMDLHPHHHGDDAADIDYVAAPLQERLPTPRECTRHALVLQAAMLRKVRRRLTMVLTDRKSPSQRYAISTRDWSGCVLYWVAAKLREAGWTVNGGGSLYFGNPGVLEIKPSVHRHIQAAALGKYFPMPCFAPNNRQAAVIAAARATLVGMLPQGSGTATLPDGLFDDEVRNLLIAELQEKHWRCNRRETAYTIEAPAA